MRSIVLQLSIFFQQTGKVMVAKYRTREAFSENISGQERASRKNNVPGTTSAPFYRCQEKMSSAEKTIAPLLCELNNL